MEEDNQILNSKDSQKKIFLDLYEIFGEAISDNIIKQVCCDCQWNFDYCVHTLIKYAEDNSKNSLDNSHLKYGYIDTTSKTKQNNNLIRCYDDSVCDKKQGAIPKNPSILFNEKAKEFASTMNSQLNNLSTAIHPKVVVHCKNHNDLQYLPNVQPVIDHINSGHKIMVIMRGAPGTGKSYFAKKIIDLTLPGDYKDFIHSTDSYFYNSSEKYYYDPQSLTDAHEYNQKIVRKKAVEGWSPIIVDNTNTKVWEMLPYVKIAVQNGYLIEILQPNTPWSNSALKLSRKNIHGVPKKKIESILNNFEPITKNQILEMMKTVNYSVPLPQMRLQPNIPVRLDLSLNKNAHNSKISKNNTDLKKNNSSKAAFLLCTHDLKTDISPENVQYSKSEAIHETIDNKQKNTVLLKNKQNIQKLEIHALNCPNENKSFYTIRQIYSNEDVYKLWDLFVKCNGDTDNLINILLKDDCAELNSHIQKTNISFTCDCDTQINQIEEDIFRNKSNMQLDRGNEILKYENHMKSEVQNYLDSKMSSIVQNKCILKDIHYQSNPQSINDQIYLEECNEKECYDKKSYDFTADEENELYEINLGTEFIKQLENICGCESKLKESLTKCHTNIFMPKSIAKQIFALWMESVYNQIEEQKQITIKDDQAFAKFLEIYLSESDNLDVDIANNIEIAWFKYNSDQQYSNNSTRENLECYSQLIKLFQNFPQIQREVIMEIFQAHGNQFDETMIVLNNSVNSCDWNKLDCMKSKNEKIYSEQAKRAALREFEKSRNHAAHHSQLKAECFEKAKEAIKRNSDSIAVYYSHIANLHNTKIDMCNQKAANCIMEVNDWKQTNPDFIDLHYLHTMEAIECLDLFLDKHINKLKNITRTYKYIFIITGRGLHSAGGISTIKNKVKTRLKDRNLKWSEVNPGLLKVKLFSSSKFSQNC